jgi:hypothetical protein
LKLDAVNAAVEEGVGQAGGVPVRGVQDADQDHGTQLQHSPISQSGCWETQGITVLKGLPHEINLLGKY